MNTDDSETYMISDFTKIKLGMTYDEVVELMGNQQVLLDMGLFGNYMN